MLSTSELLGLRVRPQQKVCQACLTHLVSELPNTVRRRAIRIEGTYEYGLGRCYVCARFSQVALFVPRDTAVKKVAEQNERAFI
jgi:hypothetical protein